VTRSSFISVVTSCWYILVISVAISVEYWKFTNAFNDFLKIQNCYHRYLELFSTVTCPLVLRSRTYMTVIAELAGLRLLHQELQRDFPEELYPVHMFAFVPM